VSLRIEALPFAEEIVEGADLVTPILAAAPPLEAGDVVVVTHKAVAKAEGRVVRLADVEPSAWARAVAGPDGDARHVEVVRRETRRVVRRRGSLIIAETRHGFVCANAASTGRTPPTRTRSSCSRSIRTPRRPVSGPSSSAVRASTSAWS
jgi:coenzyme F420-0:L-glutamate ligase/coenzyme F420-1:gamma-L-glutamate ligase